MSRVVYFYKYKEPLDSFCLDCDAPCNTILELKDGSNFHCCTNCTLKVYKFKKNPKKHPPESRKAIFRTKSCVKNQNKGISKTNGGERYIW